MKIIKTVLEMQSFSEEKRCAGKKIGFVPTMGFLHKGHLSLVKKAREECDIVIVSIFVNPTQFSPSEDFDNYPKDFETDRKLCEAEKVDAIFFPSESEMYNSPQTFVEVNELGRVLCGKSRPSHFRGVTTVVAKLLNITKPHKAYFGQKDFQQFVIVTKMVKDLNFDLKIVGCPIVREEDGLAMSSRNKYLSPDERKQAPALNSSLQTAQETFSSGETDAAKVKGAVTKAIVDAGAKPDYVEIVDASSLKPVKQIEKGNLLAIAAFFGKARLIDNRVFE
ncbi:MAG: pantoate--beta-alanine ligase [archaeon]|jgi:pantoate--beta-alanine ligase|nr:pantoate--beta-alanine ligase [archaeon]